MALAALIGGRMVTADRRLYEGLVHGQFGENVVWIENVGEAEDDLKRGN